MLDALASEIYLEYSIENKFLQAPLEITSALTLVFITLGASDFVEFLGAFFIVEVLSMCFRMYVMPLWGVIQGYTEQKLKDINRYLKKKKALQQENEQNIFDKN